ncbi:MAG: hypothetical protein JWS12_116 [Candidatus Saccharibacteria bacterium]|nr:hypothetical protein [Candidatus Saccharibacteria bacterium]
MSVEKASDLSPKQDNTHFAELDSIRAMLNPSAWSILAETLPAETEPFEVAVASLVFDEAGLVVAFGVRHSEMLRVIREQGDIEHNSAGLISIYPDRVSLFGRAGDSLWPRITAFDQDSLDENHGD